MKLGIGSRANDTELRVQDMSFAEFAQKLSSPKIGPKDGLYLVRGGLMREPKRADANLLEAELVVIDGDSAFDPETGEILPGAPDFDGAVAAFRQTGLAFVLHTTHSNRPGKPKWRAYVPAHMTHPSQLEPCVTQLVEALNANGCYVTQTRECSAWSQAWFTPRVPTEEALEWFRFTADTAGSPFDVEAAVKSHGKRSKAEESIRERVERPQPQGAQGDGPIDLFNKAATLGLVRQLLEEAGYKFAFRRGDTLRFIAPQSETRTAGVTVFKGTKRGDIVIYSHHGAHDPLSGRLTDAFGLLWHVTHRGNQEAALEDAKRAVNWKKKADPLADFDTIEVNAEDFRQARAAAEKPAGPRGPIRTLNLVDLLDDETPDEPDYIAPDFLGPGNFCLIAGPPKAQKSFLLTELLMACAMGSTFLGSAFTVPRPLKVFYLQAEMNRKLLKRRAKMMGMLEDEQKQLLRRNLVVTERFAMLLNEDGVKVAIQTIEQAFPDGGPDIIAIDPLANLFDGESEDKAPEVMKFLTGRVEAIRQKVNPLAAVIMVHHSGKKSTEDMARDPFVAIRGSGALRGYYDTGIVIYRQSEDGPERRVHFELRNGESPEPMTVRLNACGRFDVQRAPEQAISNSVAQQILDDVRAAWRAGKPLSLASQTRAEGRHVGRAMSIKHGLGAKDVEELVQAWLYNGVCSVEIVDPHTKMKGIKVVGTINSKV